MLVAAGVCICAFALTPDVLHQFAGYFWNVPGVDEATLGTVRALLPVVGIEAEIEYEIRRIIVGSFSVRVNQSCSGIEGAVLVSGFLTGIAILLRSELEPRRMAMLVVVGAVLSWFLNGIRITALIWIGVHVSPELAIDGFHSNAGWLLFVLLSVILLWFAVNIKWFQRIRDDPKPEGQSIHSGRIRISSDPVAAMILPFVLFLAPVLILPAITISPAEAYPLRAAIGMLALIAFWPVLRTLRYHTSLPAIAAGAIIAVLWIAMHTPSDAAADHEPLWIAARLLGTILIAPVVEELFFRGYLIQRLGAGSRQGLILATVLSTVIFAALHANWIMAGIAGLIFAGLMLRHGRVTDAVQAHVAANALIGGYALWTNDWTVI